MARLKPGVTLEQAQTEVNVISTRLAQEHPRSNKDLRFSVTPLRRDIADVARRPLIVLLGAALGLKQPSRRATSVRWVSRCSKDGCLLNRTRRTPLGWWWWWMHRSPVWPGRGESPLGKRMRSSPDAPWAEVVGVVGHIRHESLESDQRLQIYWNYLQRARDHMTLVVRTSGDARLLANPVLGAIKSVDPDQPAYAVRTMTGVLDQSSRFPRSFLQWSGFTE